MPPTLTALLDPCPMRPAHELHGLVGPYRLTDRDLVPWDSVLTDLRRRSTARVQKRPAYEVAVRTETFLRSRRHPTGTGWLVEPQELLSVVIRPVVTAEMAASPLFVAPRLPEGTGVFTSAADLGLSPADIQLYLDACALMQHITSTLDPLATCDWTQRCWDFQDRLRPVRDALKRQILAAAKDGPWRRRRHLVAGFCA